MGGGWKGERGQDGGKESKQAPGKSFPQHTATTWAATTHNADIYIPARNHALLYYAKTL